MVGLWSGFWGTSSGWCGAGAGGREDNPASPSLATISEISRGIFESVAGSRQSAVEGRIGRA